MFCINCGREIEAGDKFCTSCGTKVQQSEETYICVGCGKENPISSNYCMFCGKAKVAEQNKDNHSPIEKALGVYGGIVLAITGFLLMWTGPVVAFVGALCAALFGLPILGIIIAIIKK